MWTWVWRGYAEGMRVIGKSRLAVLAETADERVRGAVRAVCAELEAAKWSCAADARAAFPSAGMVGRRIAIDLDGRNRLVVDINYEMEIGLIIFAGQAQRGTMDPMGSSRTRR